MGKDLEYLLQKKKAKQLIVMLTAYDFPSAQIAEAGGVDAILVGDSVGTNVLGYSSEREVTMADMLHHTAAVARGTQNALLLADLPFQSTETPEDAERNALLLRGKGAQIVVDQRPLQEIGRSGMRLKIVEQPTQRAGREHDVAIHAQHECGAGVTKHEIARGGSRDAIEQDVAIIGNPVSESFQFRGAGSTGVIIHHDKFDLAGHLGMMQANGLDGEIDAVIVVVSRHPDRQPCRAASRRW